MQINTEKQQGSGRSDSVAVIVCSYSMQRYNFVREAIQSLLNQSRPADEIILVVSGSRELQEHVSRDYRTNKDIRIVFSEKPLNASAARNRGISETSCDILLFTDDDVVAHPDWVKNIINSYAGQQVLGVGGNILPEWLGEKPRYLPEELFWLVGAVHESLFPEVAAEVRNVFGPNMSFRRTVFEQVGYFNEQLSFAGGGKSNIQGEEPEFGIRMLHKLGRGVIYNPEAIIYHKVPPAKYKLSALFRRSFYQGYTKSLMPKYKGSVSRLAAERDYFKILYKKYIPQHIKGMFCGRDRINQLKKICVLQTSVILTGLGYLYGLARNRQAVTKD